MEPSTAELVVACAVALAGGVVQSATGFGFALIAAPGLTAALGPRVAVSTLTLIALLVNALTLGAEGRRTVVLRRRAAVLVASSIPGAAVGALLLAHLPVAVLRAVVAAVTLAAVAAYWLARHAPPLARGAWGRTAGVGALAGTIGSVAGINGPPLVLHLRRIGTTAAQARDTLAAFFLASGVLTFGALALTGALRLEARSLVLSAVAAGAGQLIGRLGFHTLTAHRDRATLATLALSAAMAAGLAVQTAVG
jgi:uncharacterized membrane protein YfcA